MTSSAAGSWDPDSAEALAALREAIEREVANGTLQITEPNDGIASEVGAAVIRSLASDGD